MSAGEVVRAGDLRPGDRFPVGGVVRTVLEVLDVGAGRVRVHVHPPTIMGGWPGGGYQGVRGGVQVRGVHRAQGVAGGGSA